MKYPTFAGVLLVLASACVFALDEPEVPRVFVEIAYDELQQLNHYATLPGVFLEIDDESNGKHLTFDIGKELLVRAEVFDPANGKFEQEKTFYRDSGELNFMLPRDFTPGDHRIYTENLAHDQEPLTSSVQIHMPGDPVRQIHSEVVGQSTLNVMAQTGPSANRVDFVLIGDGYTQAESAKWQSDAQKIVDNFFSVAPYASYRSYFNVYRIDAYSQQSGVDHPASNVLKNTAFDSTYDCQSIARLICTSIGGVRAEVEKHLPANARDLILLIVNDNAFGGSSVGNIGVISNDSSTLELAHHELGHGFADLTDEYVDPNVTKPEDCKPDVEPRWGNASKRYTERASVKWAHWIATTTPIPTADTEQGSAPGLYPGGDYCANLYRPTPNSKMRTLTRPFDAVNEELLVLRFYDFANLLESVTPTTTQTIDLRIAAVTHFSFQSLQPSMGVTATWFLDGVQISKGLTLSAGLIPAGPHTLELIVSDPTPKVRKDSTNKLSKRAAWTVIGSTSGSSTRAIFGEQRLILPAVRLPNGVVYDATLKLVQSSPSLVFELEGAVPTTRAASSGDASFSNGVLILPDVAANGKLYRARLVTVQNASALRLRLTEASLL